MARHGRNAMIQFAKKLRAILEKAGKLEDRDAGDALLAEAQGRRSVLTEIVVSRRASSTERSCSA